MYGQSNNCYQCFFELQITITVNNGQTKKIFLICLKRTVFLFVNLLEFDGKTFSIRTCYIVSCQFSVKCSPLVKINTLNE